MSNELWKGRRIRTFDVIDDFSREALLIEVENIVQAAWISSCLN
jgi:putative transposase